VSAAGRSTTPPPPAPGLPAPRISVLLRHPLGHLKADLSLPPFARPRRLTPHPTCPANGASSPVLALRAGPAVTVNGAAVGCRYAVAELWAPAPRSWNASSGNSSAARAVSAMMGAICAGSALAAKSRASRNPPVVGSSPTRPTYIPSPARKPVIWPGWLVRGTAAVGTCGQHPCRSGPVSGPADVCRHPSRAGPRPAQGII